MVGMNEVDPSMTKAGWAMLMTSSIPNEIEMPIVTAA